MNSPQWPAWRVWPFRRRAATRPSVPKGMSFQARDGTWVRSRPEMRIANWLNLHGIEYEYEPSVEGMRPDFQVVGTSILIEYWGGAGFRDYAQRMEAKIAKYEAAGYDVVSLFSVHLWELDRVLADEMSRRGLI